ncbi:hypothetical protein LG3211_2647 [Lysobacter gummosus]|nr:hypothetical protein LG3211_2647 [Lysobacter gummosus]
MGFPARRSPQSSRRTRARPRDERWGAVMPMRDSDRPGETRFP